MINNLNSPIILWKPADGWHGLLPGKSSLTDAVNTLGQFSISDNFQNGTRYEFANGTVHIYVLDNQTTIAKIRLHKGAPGKQFTFCSIIELEQIVGRLKQVDINELGAVTLERSGLRVEAEVFGQKPSVRWIELY